VGVQIVGCFKIFSGTWKTSDDKNFVLPMLSAGFVSMYGGVYFVESSRPFADSLLLPSRSEAQGMYPPQIVGGWKAQLSPTYWHHQLVAMFAIPE
jgi:hypothetical protein